MSRKMKRRLSSINYSIQKASVKLAKYRPPPLLIAAVVMGTSIFLLGGGVYDILIGPIPILPIGQGRFLSYLPFRLHEQVLIGSIGVMILYVLGALGLLLIYQSTKYIRNPRQLSLLSKIGVAFLIVAFIAVEAELYWILNFPV